MAKKILIFGYGHHGRQIAYGLREDGYDITIVVQDKERFKEARKEEFEVHLINMEEDKELLALNLEKYDRIVCMMDDEHYNVFLTLSLNALVEGLYIVAISDSIHVTNKLRLAGAKRVIDMYEVSANRIHNMLYRPIATELLDDFIASKEGISLMEMTIPKGSFLHGKMSDEVNFSHYGVLLVGLIDFEHHKGFEFVTAGHNHHLDTGDIIVCMGEVERLRIFKKMIAKKENFE